MNYDFLGQDSVTVSTVAPRNFFQRMFPRFFPVVYQPQFYPQNVAPCIPVPVPAGTLGRDANGNLTINGQTHCYTQPAAAVPIYPTYRRFF